jgi:hypothetical protein
VGQGLAPSLLGLAPSLLWYGYSYSYEEKEETNINIKPFGVERVQTRAKSEDEIINLNQKSITNIDMFNTTTYTLNMLPSKHRFSKDTSATPIGLSKNIKRIMIILKHCGCTRMLCLVSPPKFKYV